MPRDRTRSFYVRLAQSWRPDRACRDIPYVLEKLSWKRAERIWPNRQRYTWTDAFGVVLLVSLYEELGKPRFLNEAEWVVSDVDRVLGRPLPMVQFLLHSATGDGRV
jgi:hypothetical protein